MCRVGSDADGPGREHWTAMLANPRKPIEHWHQLMEVDSVTAWSVCVCVCVSEHVKINQCVLCVIAVSSIQAKSDLKCL